MSTEMPMHKRQSGVRQVSAAVHEAAGVSGSDASGLTEISGTAYASALEHENAALKQIIALALLENLALKHKLARRQG